MDRLARTGLFPYPQALCSIELRARSCNAAARPSTALPPNIPAPTLAPVTSILGEVMYIALRSDRHDAMTVKAVADWTVRRRLLAVPGVAQVVPTGGETRQYQVLVDPVKLAAYRIGLDEVSAALGEANENTAAGFFVENGQEYLIYGLGRVHSPEDIGETLVALREGVPVRVADPAEVRSGATSNATMRELISRPRQNVKSRARNVLTDRFLRSTQPSPSQPLVR